MRKLPIVILGCVALFLTVVVGLLLTKARAPKRELLEPTQTKADYRIKEVHLQEEDRGRARWQLDADYGEVFEDQGKTVMKKVTIRIDEPTRAWTVVGDEASSCATRGTSYCGGTSWWCRATACAWRPTASTGRLRTAGLDR
jgi:LPS export ABC transporter protein LptC